jgi:hypothetical protein
MVWYAQQETLDTQYYFKQYTLVGANPVKQHSEDTHQCIAVVLNSTVSQKKKNSINRRNNIIKTIFCNTHCISGNMIPQIDFCNNNIVLLQNENNIESQKYVLNRFLLNTILYSHRICKYSIAFQHLQMIAIQYCICTSIAFGCQCRNVQISINSVVGHGDRGDKLHRGKYIIWVQSSTWLQQKRVELMIYSTSSTNLVQCFEKITQISFQ